MLTARSLAFFFSLKVLIYFYWCFPFRRNELARKVAKDFLLDLQSGTLDL